MNEGAPIIGVISGKGGVGKTNLVANLGVCAARRGARALAIDGDVGLSNLDILLGLKVEWNVAHLLAGECEWADALLTEESGLRLLPGASGRPELTGLRPRELSRLLLPLFESRNDYDLTLLDLAAGVAPSVLSLAMACDRLILVTTPEPTSLADAYAVVKTLAREGSEIECEVVVNGVRNRDEAREVHDRLRRVAQRFLGIEPPMLGHVPMDSRLVDAVKRQQPVVRAFPSARASRALRELTDRLIAIPTRAGRSSAFAHPVEV